MHKIVNFQSIPGQQLVNQEAVDPQVLEQIRLQQKNREKRMRSRLVTGLMGIGGIASLYAGNKLYNSAGRDYWDIIGQINQQKMHDNRTVRDLVESSRKGVQTQLLGTGLTLAGLYHLVKAGKRAIDDINSSGNNHQSATQYNLYNSYPK